MRNLLIGLLLLGFMSAVSAQSIGMAPGSYNTGEVQKGEEIDFEIYLTVSGTNENITVKPFVKERSPSPIFDDEGAIDSEKYSEQDVTSWIKWDEETFTINPRTSETRELPSGSTVRADGEISGTLRVPSGGEPGFHSVQIGVSPQTSEDSGYGASVFGLTRVPFTFYVPGDVERSIEVSDASARRVEENQAQFVFTLRNTGTVTTETLTSRFRIFSGDEKVGSSTITSVKIPPGETRRVESLWVTTDLEGGNYRVVGSADYRTSEGFFRESVSLAQAPQDPIEVQDPSEQGSSPDGEEASPPLLLILVVGMVVGASLYVIGMEMFMVLSGASLSAITIFILTTGAPVYMLGLAVAAMAAVVYFRW